jgi:hypothetical protein
MSPDLARQYGLLAALLTAFTVVLWFVATQEPLPASDAGARDLIHPVMALVGLTAIVWLLMFIYRNVAVARGIAKIGYYRGYSGEAPPEWVERPARTFANLLEVPVLFYVAAILMLQTNQWDSVQVALSWLFVATRTLHAAVYIGLNIVPLRLAAYLMSCITLIVIWWRFALAMG